MTLIRVVFVALVVFIHACSCLSAAPVDSSVPGGIQCTIGADGEKVCAYNDEEDEVSSDDTSSSDDHEEYDDAADDDEEDEDTEKDADDDSNDDDSPHKKPPVVKPTKKRRKGTRVEIEYEEELEEESLAVQTGLAW